MREILFRAKRKDNGEWVEGSLVKIEENCFRIATQEDVAYAYPDKTTYAAWMYDVCEDTICQYTGIKDKNGNKIFEGDIVKDIYTNKGYVMQVEWNDYYCGFEPFCLCDNYGEKLYLERNEDCIIVGNVFDNQEIKVV